MHFSLIGLIGLFLGLVVLAWALFGLLTDRRGLFHRRSPGRAAHGGGEAMDLGTPEDPRPR